jgi:hypothetical protein
MQMFNFIMAIFLIICANKEIEIDAHVKKIAKKDFYDDYLDYIKLFKDSAIHEFDDEDIIMTKKCDVLNSTTFFIFSFKMFEPNPKNIVFKNQSEIGLLDTFIKDGDEIVSPNLIKKMNKFIQLEKKGIKNNDFKKFINFLLFTKYKRDLGIKIINSWEQIKHDDNYPISTKVRKIIEPFKILKSNDQQFIAHFYCWDPFSTILYECTFEYSFFQPKIYFSSSKITKVGIPHVIL